MHSHACNLDVCKRRCLSKHTCTISFNLKRPLEQQHATVNRAEHSAVCVTLVSGPTRAYDVSSRVDRHEIAAEEQQQREQESHFPARDPFSRAEQSSGLTTSSNHHAQSEPVQ